MPLTSRYEPSPSCVQCHKCAGEAAFTVHERADRAGQLRQPLRPVLRKFELADHGHRTSCEVRIIIFCMHASCFMIALLHSVSLHARSARVHNRSSCMHASAAEPTSRHSEYLAYQRPSCTGASTSKLCCVVATSLLAGGNISALLATSEHRTHQSWQQMIAGLMSSSTFATTS
jgi:hypothetical protein